MALEMITDDRAAAVMGAAFLEYTLRSAIRARLREMETKELEAIFDNHGHGALATFSQMIWVGYALNLFGPETRADLALIKEIRNAFAHEPEEICFDDADVVKLCAKLRAPKKLAHMNMKAEPQKPRRRYEDSLHFFAARVHIIGEKHLQRPLAPPDIDLS
jgi:hypothetical protein